MKKQLGLVKILLLICAFVFGESVKADILILQYGDIVAGTILKTNEDGIDFLQQSGKIHWPISMVKEALQTDGKTNSSRISSWVNIISQLTTNDWAHDFKQIPATVIDNGILKDVPYISFRCNTAGYEINIYGDLENPACVEIGAIGYNVKNSQAKSNCVSFISSILTQVGDQTTVRSLKWEEKDTKKQGGMTFEVTLPGEPDSYGGWWISAYDETELTKSRASGPEMLAITQPKVKPVAARPPVTEYWSDNDISSYSRPIPSQSINDGNVYVRGYYRKNGTYVSGYRRHGK